MTTSWVRLYARGFFFGPAPVGLLEDLEHFQRHDLPGGVLYVDEITELSIATAGDDWVVTLGKILPLSTGILDASSPDYAEQLLRQLQRDGFAGIETALYDVGGRHAVLLRSNGNIYAYNDAAGHRTVHFNHAQQRIASHFDMLHRLTNPRELTCSLGSKRPETSPDGMWDLTDHPDIRALLPNHRLQLAHGTQPRFGLVQPNPFIELTWTQRIHMIHELWHEQLAQVFAHSPHGPVGMSLSGGLDSRTVLAHMRPYRERTRAFTYTSSNIATGKAPASFWQRTMVTDHNILSQMQDHLPEDFAVIIKPGDDILTDADHQTLARNTTSNHGWPYVRKYKDLFPNLNSIHVRGNFVEMGRLIRGRLDIPDKKDRFAQVAEEIIRRRRPAASRYREFFWHKFTEFEYDRLHENVEYTDAYHWENRSSRWYAEVANETDTVFDSIVPVNVRRIYELLISQPLQVRPTAQLQRDLIHHAWPELLAYGINTEDDLYTTTLRDDLLGELT
ncbi:hypothetical protein [Enteractinococcus coprophilus]|uniref:Asparagine synthase (Glutamine-hydrolysing) n=1 Tax=Enteractinococcus coprophilus TaxID=1027633 RepID=A0A543AG15_9MICC|nr:hypothetical protein [Enteractinococcus coprophilus]TQL71510.1 hypothetical protein FB556_1998 [Enteractinococcus coprophilus]